MTPQQVVMAELVAGGMSEADAAVELDKWEVVPYEQDGELALVGMFKGNEFHCKALPNFDPKRRDKVREAFAPYIAREGYITTRLEHGDTANRRFNRLFGFEPTWSDERYTYFVLKG